ncbi:hypothetical protein ACFLYO_10580, partial [Chloroflexota bacterium]
EIEDGDGDTIYSEAHSVATGTQSTSIYISRGDMDKKPDENPLKITVLDGDEEVDTLKVDSPCLEDSDETPEPEEAENDRGVYRLYANFQDTILYYPGEEGGLEAWYVSPDGVGLFVGRFPKAQLDSSQEPSTTPIATWTWGEDGWLSWSLYYIGGGQYQVNHYIGGVLNFEHAFTP